VKKWVISVLLGLALTGTSFAAAASGKEALKAGKMDEAITLLRAATRERANDAEAWHLLSRAYLSLERWDDAVKAAEKAVALETNNSDYHLWLGRAYGNKAQRANPFRQAGLARKTKREFERAVQLDPDNLDAREDVVEYYLQAPGIMGGSVDKARVEAAAIQQRDQRRGHLVYARIAEHEKQPAEAQRHYEGALAASTTHADSVSSILRLGIAFQQSKQWDRAFETFEDAVRRMPDEMGLWFQIGRTGALSGQRLERAEAALVKYLSHEPTRTEPPLAYAHFRLGQVYEHKQDYTRARAEYQAAVALDPKLKDAQTALARLK